MRRGLRAAALVMALVLLLGTVAAATDINYDTKTNANAKEKNGIQVAPLDSQNCKVEFKDNSSEALTVTYTNEKLNVNDMVIVLLLKSDKAVTSDTEAEDVKPTLTAGTIQYIDQADVETAGTVTFRVFPQNYSNGVIRLIWKDKTSDGVNTATVAAVNRTYTLGDVNDDGDINILDVAATLYYYVGRSSGDNINLLAADVNGDKSVNILDVAAILYYYAKDIPFTQSN